VRVEYESVESGVKVVRNSHNPDAITHFIQSKQGENSSRQQLSWWICSM
jgi:hypothetical protein